ncbi:MAG: alpha/beta fold hydrolase [Myxococcaceae bacterium]
MDLLGTGNRVLRRVLVARGVRSLVAQLKGHEVHYYRLGGTLAQTPVVLLHGLGGQANGFSRTLFRLEKRFGAVYALDLPGHGFSPVPPGGPLSLAEQVEVAGAFLGEVVGKAVFLVGNSLGGAMSIALAHLSPGRVKALGLIAPAGAKVSEERLAGTFRALDVGTTREARALTRRLFHRAPWPMLLLSSELRTMYGSAAVKHVFAETKATDHIAPEVLATLGMPTLLVWGASEKVLPFEGVEYFRQHLPRHAEVHVVEGFGHIPQMERPRELVELLVRFADRSRL